MIRVTVSYPNEKNATFDHEYYQNGHRRIVHGLLAPYGLLRVEIDRTLASGDGGTPPVLAAAHLVFEDIEGFQRGMAEVGGDILADIPNYTNVGPVILIAEMID